MFEAKQLSVCLPHEKGQLAKLARCLADAGVNILAVSVTESTEVGVVRLVVDYAETAARALEGAGMPCAQTDVLVAQLPNEVGVLAEVAENLAAEGVNINFVYGSTTEGRGATHVVIGCTNASAAEKVLAEY